MLVPMSPCPKDEVITLPFNLRGCTHQLNGDPHHTRVSLHPPTEVKVSENRPRVCLGSPHQAPALEAGLFNPPSPGHGL